MRRIPRGMKGKKAQPSDEEVWRFRNIDSGKVIKIKAPDLDAAWKEIQKDYSDPIHAVQYWVAMDID